MAEMAFGQFVHPVPATDTIERAPGIEREADDHRVVDRADGDPATGQHVEIVLAVLEHLEHGIARQQRLQGFEHLGAVDLLRLFGEHVAPAVR